MRYIIKKTTDPAKMQSGVVETYPWGGDYRPRMEFRVGYDDGGLHVHLKCWETNPKVAYIGRNNSVWNDSCMEFFFSPSADLSAGYFNCEMNSHPSMLLHYGLRPGDESRVCVEWPDEAFDLTCTKDAESWALHVYLPFAMVQKYVPGFAPASGMVLRTNVYKCGDETDVPHYGCHFPIDASVVTEPAFHVPEFFGEMELE